MPERVDTAIVGGGQAGLATSFLLGELGRAHVVLERGGLDAPEAGPARGPRPPVAETGELDLAAAGVTTILWATGFRPDYSWVDLPLVDGDGWAAQERGVTEYPGLYVVGSNWLHKRKSALLCGVGEDAEHVARQLAAHT